MSAGAGSRSQILASIRQSLQVARHIPEPPATGQIDSASPLASGAELAAQFGAELSKVGGTMVRLPAAGVAEWLLGWLNERKVESVLAWQPALLPVPGLLDALQAKGVRIVDTVLPADQAAHAAALAAVERVTVGLTGADAAFANTGTLALTSGVGRPRLASLSVSTHVALLSPRQMYPSWAAWLAAEAQGAGQRLAGASNLALITGPSRTGDIEMTLTVGVHGPREVIVVLVD